MGRKSSSKNHTTPPVVPAQSRSGPNPLLLAVIAVAVIGIAVFAFWRGDSSSPTAAGANPATPAAADAPKTAKGEGVKAFMRLMGGVSSFRAVLPVCNGLMVIQK